MDDQHERAEAMARLSADITRAAKKAKLPYRSIDDLIRTDVRYPELIPVLIDWLKNLGAKSGLKNPRHLTSFRDFLSRALTTADSLGTEAMPLLFDQFYVEPRMPEHNMAAVSNALDYLALPSDFDRMAALAVDRSLGFGRAGIIKWLCRQDLEEGLQIVIDQLDDPSVRPYVVRHMREFKPLPAGLRPTIEQYLDDPDSEVRKQAARTLKKLPD